IRNAQHDDLATPCRVPVVGGLERAESSGRERGGASACLFDVTRPEDHLVSGARPAHGETPSLFSRSAHDSDPHGSRPSGASALVRRATRDQCSERREGRMKLERVVALSGGVGGSRFLDGLTRELPSGALTAIVNTGDDFEHLGLYVCPDLDTVMYTLAAVGDELRGWGLAGETFAAMTMLRRYGGPEWFHLGDRDLATHVLRTAELRRGESLSAVTTRLCGAFGIAVRVLPMTDAPCRTLMETVEEGPLPDRKSTR